MSDEKEKEPLTFAVSDQFRGSAQRNSEQYLWSTVYAAHHEKYPHLAEEKADEAVRLFRKRC